MAVTCVVQARMGSSRLPGKVLMDLGGHQLLAFLLRRLACADIDALVVATSVKTADDPVADVAAAAGAKVVRGSEEDVLGRFAIALDQYPADVAVRITADCPLTDPAIVSAVLELQKTDKADYTSNTLIRTFPDGLDVEVMTVDALRAAETEAIDSVEREHVTPFIYRRPERFRLTPYNNEECLGDERWTVDEAEDLEFLREVVRRLGNRTDFQWRDVLTVAGRRALPGPGELRLRPAMASDTDFLISARQYPDSVGASLGDVNGEGPRSGKRAWFRAHLQDPARRTWIAEVDGERVGQVRVDVKSAVGEIAIAAKPAPMGHDYRGSMLATLQKALLADHQIHTLMARISRDNVASLAAFDQVGFLPVDESSDVLTLRWLRGRRSG